MYYKNSGKCKPVNKMTTSANTPKKSSKTIDEALIVTILVRFIIRTLQICTRNVLMKASKCQELLMNIDRT